MINKKNNSCENNHLRQSGLGMESPTLFTTPRTKTNSLQGARVNASHTLTSQHGQTTTTMSEDLLGESGLSNNSSQRTNKVCASLDVWGNWRAREKCLRERERKRELVWKWNWVANKVKHAATTTTTPVSGQLNHQESGKIPSPPSTNSSQNHISMTSPWQSRFENTLPQYPGDSEWRGNESQLTRPLSVKELHHQEGLQIHEAPYTHWPFIVAINCLGILGTTVRKKKRR